MKYSQFNIFNWPMFVVLIYLLTYPYLMTILPTLEGRLFPVITEVKITEVNAVIPNWVSISGTGNKVRACTWRSTETYIERHGVSVYVPSKSVGPRRVNAGGPFVFGSIELQTDISNFEDLVIYTYHDCHPIYLTKTMIYKKSPND